jgi:glycosyltransferase involved in cell wall biosynthesis
MLARLTREKGLDGIVIFAGFQPDVSPYLAAFDLFVEAMAMAKPVVATSVGGIPEVIDDGVTGFLVPPRDPESLVRKIRFLLAHPEVRAKMGEAGRLRVLARFSTERMIGELQRLYGELIG